MQAFLSQDTKKYHGFDTLQRKPFADAQGFCATYRNVREKFFPDSVCAPFSPVTEKTIPVREASSGETTTLCVAWIGVPRLAAVCKKSGFASGVVADDFQSDQSPSGSHHTQLLRSSFGKIDDPPTVPGAAIIDLYIHRPFVAEVGDTYGGPQR